MCHNAGTHLGTWVLTAWLPLHCFTLHIVSKMNEMAMKTRPTTMMTVTTTGNVNGENTIQEFASTSNFTLTVMRCR